MLCQFYSIDGIYKWGKTEYIGWEETKTPNSSQTKWEIAIKVKLTKVKF